MPEQEPQKTQSQNQPEPAAKPPLDGPPILLSTLAEATNSLPAVPGGKIATQAVSVLPDNTLSFLVRSTDKAGNQFSMTVTIDNELPVEKWGILQRAGVAKMDIMSPWSSESLTTIINAIVFAEKQGLSFEEGDVYKTPGGRLSTTAKAKQKRGQASGLIRSFTVETFVRVVKAEETSTTPPKTRYKHIWIPIDDYAPNGELAVEKVSIPWATRTQSGKYEGPNLLTVVTVETKDLDKPIIVRATLEEWFKGENENWRQRPRYMLEENAKGKAFDMVKPSGTDIDAIPGE